MRERPIAGQRIVITGATSGIGTEIARALARRGAALTLVARSKEKADATAAEIAAEPGADGAPEIVLGDLGDLASVRRAGAELCERYDRIDVLVNNAGVNHMVQRTSVDGFDDMIATNYLGPFLLTHLLLDRVRKAAPSRIVVTASEAHRMALGIEVARFAEPTPYNVLVGERRYGQSKLADILFAQELAERLEGTGVTVNAFCPGFVDTGISRDSSAFSSAARLGTRLRVVRRPAAGARMGVRLVLDADLEGVTGRFFTSTPGLKFLPTTPTRRDRELRKALWRHTADLVGVDPDHPAQGLRSVPD